MRGAIPITAAPVAPTVLVAPITTRETATDCETTNGETTTCVENEETNDDMTDTTPESGSSAFTPGVGAAVVALLGALYVTRGR